MKKKDIFSLKSLGTRWAHLVLRCLQSSSLWRKSKLTTNTNRQSFLTIQHALSLYIVLQDRRGMFEWWFWLHAKSSLLVDDTYPVLQKITV